MRNDENTNQKYTLLWDGQEIPVTREVYQLMFREEDEEYNEWRRQIYNNITVESYDNLLEKGFEAPSPELTPEQGYEAQDSFLSLLQPLSSSEREIIIFRFYYCLTEAELADCLSIRQQAVNKKINQILEKLRESI